MPVQVSYPGVYIEEVPSGVRTIAGVSTSVTAFVGYLERGPMNTPVQVFNKGDFERAFGGLTRQSEVGYAVEQFFLNGGTEAWVVRTASGDFAKADVRIQTDFGGGMGLIVTAINPGDWGNRLRVSIDYPTPASDSLFNMTISLMAARNDEQVVVQSEVFRGLSMSEDDTSYVEAVVNDESTGSKLVRVEAKGSERPQQTGTLSGDLESFPPISEDSPQMEVTIGEDSATAMLEEKPTSLRQARRLLEAAIRAANSANSAFAQATVSIVDNRLRILAGPTDPSSRVLFAATTDDETTAGELKLDQTNAQANVQMYTLGRDGGVADTAQGNGKPGNNGDPSDANALIGNRNDKTGIYALEDVDLFNILCIPRTATVDGSDNALTANDAFSVITAASGYCAERRAFFIVDTPNNINEVQAIKDWLEDNNIRHKNSAVYFPRVKIPDPLNDFKLRSMGASGILAGLYARTDAARGVWKAPAGIEAILRGVRALDYKLTDQENGVLNPLGVNALRSFRNIGNVSWGARTLKGSDQLASEWKYIPVRRTALFIEESLYRGTQWVVFEPNDESLWAQIRLNVGTFMQRLFRQGAFQGTSPRQAYFVKCDSETTTQDHINQGIVNIEVGFAPLKPAEFVIIKIQQIAGQE